jgi:hypothetical protein
VRFRLRANSGRAETAEVWRAGVKVLTPVFKSTPVGLLDALAVAIGVHSVTLIILGIQYGYITSAWRFVASLLAHFI